MGSRDNFSQRPPSAKGPTIADSFGQTPTKQGSTTISAPDDAGKGSAGKCIAQKFDDRKHYTKRKDVGPAGQKAGGKSSGNSIPGKVQSFTDASV